MPYALLPLMIELELAESVDAPTLEIFDLCTKDSLLLIADHY